MRVGIVGCGRIGGRHLDAYQRLDGVQVVVADEDEVAAKSLAQAQGVSAVGAEELLASGIDALDVCVPSQFHRQWILAGLSHGLHVFCEKPLCLSHSEALEILEAAQAARRNVMVGYLYRYHPSFQFMKSVISEGAIGRPHLALARLGGRGSHQRWKHDTGGGGAIFEMMVHMLDLVNWLLGPLEEGRLLHNELILPVRQINGEAWPAQATDCAIAVLTAGGVRAICQSDLVTPSFRNSVEVHGDNGSVTGSILNSLPAMVYCNEPRGLFDRGHNHRPFEAVNLFVRELDHFCRKVRSNDLDLSSLAASVELAQFVDSLVESR
ncbi:MAG: Gfo/Idh/MocA family oxidoreductase [Actinobacteria bacterium]|nr:Gfo/Idh/MocA family oxidoreductase [Actinomycetota bacterium]